MGNKVTTIFKYFGVVPYYVYAFIIPETGEMVEIAFVQEEGN